MALDHINLSRSSPGPDQRAGVTSFGFGVASRTLIPAVFARFTNESLGALAVVVWDYFRSAVITGSYGRRARDTDTLAVLAGTT